MKIDVNAPSEPFSLFATGTLDGGILNAVTFLLGASNSHTANSLTTSAQTIINVDPEFRESDGAIITARSYRKFS